MFYQKTGMNDTLQKICVEFYTLKVRNRPIRKVKNFLQIMCRNKQSCVKFYRIYVNFYRL
jgi:hypothetical protein